MSASTHLAKYSVTVAQARDFIVANINTPQNIYNTAKQYGVTNQMLAEIYGGVTAVDVRNFFSNIGFDSSALDPQIAPAPVSAPKQSFEERAQPAIDKLFSLNTARGILSDDSLRGALSKLVGDADYYKVFSFAGYAEGQDGKLTPAELETPGLEITKIEQLDSLFFGYLVNFIRSVDKAEALEIEAFSITNKDALLAGEKAAVEKYEDLYIGIIEDEAPFNNQFYSNAETREIVLQTGQQFIYDVIDNGRGFLYNIFDMNLTIEYNY